MVKFVTLKCLCSGQTRRRSRPCGRV